jgi:TonB family protein
MAQEITPRRVVGMEYPPLGTQARIQGTVKLECEIDHEGSVARTRIISGPNLLAEAARDNVAKWRFEKRDKKIASGALKAALTYIFVLRGTAARPTSEFVFEYPNSVILTAEEQLVSHGGFDNR